MDYFEKEKLKKRIEEDIKELEDYPEVDHFIEANFRQFMTHGEYDDNSLDLSYHYKMLKEIEADERFMSKLYFVLSKYVPNKIINDKKDKKNKRSKDENEIFFEKE
jgi:DNA-binding SARP family transcriptional activator